MAGPSLNLFARPPRTSTVPEVLLRLLASVEAPPHLGYQLLRGYERTRQLPPHLMPIIVCDICEADLHLVHVPEQAMFGLGSTCSLEALRVLGSMADLAVRLLRLGCTDLKLGPECEMPPIGEHDLANGMWVAAPLVASVACWSDLIPSDDRARSSTAVWVDEERIASFAAS